jgi:subtilisin family serine protease
MTSEPLPAAPQDQPSALPPRPGCWAYGLFGVVSLWIIAASCGIEVGAWFTEQFLLIEGIPMPWYAWPLIVLGHGLVLSVPVLLLMTLTRAPRLRAAYQTWALAIGYLSLVGLARVFDITRVQLAVLTQIALSLIAVIVVMLLARSRARLLFRFDILIPVAALVPILIAPSLAWGALGSPMDILLNLLAGVSLGLFAGILMGVFLFRPVAQHTSSPGWDMALGGFAAGVTLFILGSGFSLGGNQLLLMISLPWLGWAVAGAVRLAGVGPDDAGSLAWLPIAGLVGLVAAAPLTFVDPDEMTMLLGGSEIMDWALRAAILEGVLAVVVGVALFIARRQINGPFRSKAAWGALAATWLAAALVYAFVGQPGFYGEQLFVILRDQADLRPAHDLADRNERLRYVYTTLTQHADRTQAGLRSTLDQLHVQYRSYYLVNAIEVNGGPLLRAYLASRPEVDRILTSQHLRPLPAPAPASKGDKPAPAAPTWNVTSIGADRVWGELHVTGKGIVIGQSDSGVQGDHPALRDTYRGNSMGGQDNRNWLDPWNQTRAPSDISGHGTHTLGSIVGKGGIGIAPEAEWFACVNLARNLGNPGWYLNCMQFMLAPYPQGGDPFRDGDPTLAAHVLNNSWGCPPIEGCDANALFPAASALEAAGIFVVGSAGNEGPFCGSVSDPIALYADVFTVGAVDQSGGAAFFSSRGPVKVDGSGRVKPDLLAPGVDVLSSLPGDAYGIESGTSMAGPQVVGVVALMWSAQPKLIGNIERTRQILEQTARPYRGPQDNCSTGVAPNNTAGYGIVDAYAAVKAALAEK